jgi:hypothetical protein
VEAGVYIGRVGGPSFTDMPSIPKGVIWLFVATIAEVTPAASLTNFVALSYFVLNSTLQVFVSLDLNGRHFLRPIGS